jgi:hypothetical protein
MPSDDVNASGFRIAAVCLALIGQQAENNGGEPGILD